MSPEKIKQDITTINQWPTRYGFAVKGIVIHSMWGTYKGSIEWFKNPKAVASAHYVISAEGEISLCVPEEHAAWHAGVITVAKEDAPQFLQDNWGTNLNLISIGCELEDRRNKNYNYPAAEYEACIMLVSDICIRHSIPVDRGHIIMHEESDPINRSDPVGNWNHDKFIQDVLKQIKFGNQEEGGVQESNKRFYPIDPLKKVTVYAESDGAYVRSEPLRRSVKKTKLLPPFYEMVQTNLSGSKFISPGNSFKVKGFIEGEDINSNNLWWVSEYGNYVWSGATVDKPDITNYPDTIVDKISEGLNKMTQSEKETKVAELKLRVEELQKYVTEAQADLTTAESTEVVEPIVEVPVEEVVVTPEVETVETVAEVTPEVDTNAEAKEELSKLEQMVADMKTKLGL